MKHLIIFILLIGAVFYLESCAVNPVTGKKQVMFLSEEQEINLGKQSDPSIVASFGLYDDAKIQAFINEKGQQMAKVSHRPDLQYTFKVLDSPVINAFALPGGYVYFTRGILAHFNNEAEFAGVLGHEIGHITARHGARQYTKQILAQVGLIAGVVVSPTFRTYADVAQQGLGLLFLKFSRDNETESDELGVEYSTKIGYDAREMAGFFNTLDRVSGGPEGRIPTFMSTHPDPGDRNNKVDQMARQWQRNPQYRNTKVNRNSYLQMIDGIVYGEDPKQGYVENNNFYHPELLFQYPVPRNWQVANSPQAVQMAPKDGKALLMLTLAGEPSLQEAANASLEQYKLTRKGSRNTSVNGFNALEVRAEQVNEQTQEAVEVLMYFIQYGKYIYKFLGVSARNDFQQYESTFKTTMTGFKKLTDQNKINRKPERIKVRRVDQGGTLKTVLTRMGVPANRHEEMSIINGLKLQDPVSKGMLIKTVTK